MCSKYDMPFTLATGAAILESQFGFAPFERSETSTFGLAPFALGFSGTQAVQVH